MLSKPFKAVSKHWTIVLVLIVAISFFINIVIFYPGYMSGDTIRHFNQATGAAPFNDLQPPIQPLVWKFLIFLTGKVSSMLIFQLLLLWASLLGLALFVWRQTKNRLMSLLPVAFGFLPFIINISGVIWSDNQLAFCLTLAVVLLLNIKLLKKGLARNLILALTLILTVYAGLVRNNALIAILPIAYLLIQQSQLFIKTKIKIAASIGIIIFIVFMIPVVKVITGAEHTTSTAGPMMDDVVQIASNEDIERLNIDPTIKTTLLKIKSCTIEKKIVVDSFPCGDERDKANILIYFTDDIKTAWYWVISNKPADFLLRKIKVFVYVLFPPEGRGYIWHEGVDQNHQGVKVKYPELGELTRMYVFNFGFKHFKYLYEPWFWLLINAAMFYWSFKIKVHKEFVRALSSSAVLYIFSFFPTGVAADYRYIYWPVLAGLVSILLIVVGKKSLHRQAVPKNLY